MSFRAGAGTVLAHTQATNEQPPGGQPGSELLEPPAAEQMTVTGSYELF